MGRHCNFCSQPDAGYVCPKCGLSYCSLNCYRHRNHLECSELFYKDLVLQELSLDNEGNKRMKEATLKLLEKMRLDEESQEMENQLLLLNKNERKSSTASSVLISPITDEYGLPVEERAKFDKLVKSGGIFNLLPAHFWDPWYIKFSQSLILKDQASRADSVTSDERSKIITDQTEERDEYEDVEDEDDDDIPSYPTDLPKLTDIINKEPSPLIKCSLVQTIFAYCAICRYFVGSHHSYPVEPYDLLIRLSSLDSPKISFPTTGQCLQFSSRYLIECNKMPLLFIEKLYLDTILIIKHGNRLILRCLVDIVKLCKGAKKKKKDKTDGINKIVKKMKFYMSWCFEKEKLYQSELACIQFEALSFKQLVNESHEINSNQQQPSEETSKSDRKLIQVIDSTDIVH